MCTQGISVVRVFPAVYVHVRTDLVALWVLLGYTYDPLGVSLPWEINTCS